MNFPYRHFQKQFLNQLWFRVTTNRNFEEIIGNWRLHNQRVLYNITIKIFINPFIDFFCTFLFWILYHNTLYALIVLRFDSAASTRRTAVFFLKTKTSVNRWSDFLALVFLKVTEGPGDIVLLSVNISGVKTIAATKTYIYWFWS